jgi:Flp pilus assembly protein TadD
LEKAVDALPDFAPAHLGVGLAYERLGELEDALPPIRQALKLNPHDFATQQAIGRIERTLSQEN